MRLSQLIATLTQNGTFNAMNASLRSQFGRGSRRYIGAELMPERLLPADSNNVIRATTLLWRAVIAVDQPRYAPTVKRSSAVGGSQLLQTATAGAKADFTVQDADLLSSLRGDNLTIRDGPRVVELLTNGVIIPLVENVERHRWQAMVGAQVTLAGDNNYREVVNYSNPANSRVAIAPGAWAGGSYDALADYMARIAWLRNNGFEPVRSVTSSTMLNKFLANQAVRASLGDIVINGGGTFSVTSPVPSLSKINQYFAANNLPPVETYDLQYRNMVGTGRFLPVDAWVITGSTGLNENVDLGDNTQEMLENTLGYVAVGTVAGQGAPGRYSRFVVEEEYPPVAWAEGVQETLPIIQQPNGVTVMTGG